MNRLAAVLLGLLAFAALCFFCIGMHAPMIQADLLSRSQQAVAGAGIAAAALTIDGRDVTLHGPAGSAAVSDTTRSAVDAVEGIRTVALDVLPVAAPLTAAPAAPAPAHVVAQAKLNDLLAAAVVEFNIGSAELTPRGRAVLDRIEPILASVPDVPCDISGHTDSAGNPADNQVLSARRAEATKAYLVAKGIAAARLSTAGFGSTKPIATNDTVQGRQLNRRIEFQLKGRN